MAGKKKATGNLSAAKSAKKKDSAKDDKSIEQSLWDTANKLRGSVESSEYKHAVLSLIFLKFASDKFEHRRAELIEEGKEKYVGMVEFYAMKNVFYLPEESRWSFVQQHSKQEKMILAIRGIAGNLGDVAGDTFFKDQHQDLKADFIMANPPFNQKEWRASDELVDDPRWDGYEVPPTGNANYGWIQHMISKLSEHGVAGL